MIILAPQILLADDGCSESVAADELHSEPSGAERTLALEGAFQFRDAKAEASPDDPMYSAELFISEGTLARIAYNNRSDLNSDLKLGSEE